MAGTGLPKVLAEIMIWYLILVCASVYGQHQMSSTDTSTLALESTLWVDLEFTALSTLTGQLAQRTSISTSPALRIKTCIPEPSWRSNSPLMCVW